MTDEAIEPRTARPRAVQKRRDQASWRLGSRTSPEMATAPCVLLLPLGSTEQHGPHLPLDTDARVAWTVADEVARRRAARDQWDVVVAPLLPYGASGEHQGFAGTLSIGTAALELVLVELVRSAGPEFPRIIVVNGHGGNVEALARAQATLAREQRPIEVWSPRLEGGDTHAGRTETSLMLGIDASTVRTDRLEPGVTTPLAELMPALRAGGLAAVTPNGVLGDPTGATAAEGHDLLIAMIDDLDALVGDNHPMEST